MLHTNIWQCQELELTRLIIKNKYNAVLYNYLLTFVGHNYGDVLVKFAFFFLVEVFNLLSHHLEEQFHSQHHLSQNLKSFHLSVRVFVNFFGQTTKAYVFIQYTIVNRH